jgi:nucleoside-diphosphate kinase
MDRTFIICKPDAVERGLVGEILSRFEARNLKIVALQHLAVSEELAAAHYAEHAGRGFYGDLISFITRSPVVAVVIEGPEDTWEVARTMIGATNPRKAAPGTIRGDLGIEFTENLVHGSDSAESAQREIALWFPNS